MKNAFLALVAHDSRSFVNALSQLGFIGEGANRAAIEQAMSLMIERYYGLSLGEINEQVIAEIVQDVKHLLYGQAFHIPAQFAFTGRAISTLVGVSTGLAPEFKLIEVATPYARKFLGLDIESAEQTLQQLFIQLLDSGRALLTLPRSLEQVLTTLETGQIEVKLAGNELRGWMRLRGRRNEKDNGASSGEPGLTRPFMFVASLAGGIFLLSDAHQFIAGWFCFSLAGLITLGVLVKS